MSNIDKRSLSDEAIKKAFAGTNFGRDDFKNILAETVIDAAAGWRCGYTATTICTELGLLTPKGRASALGLRFISEHVQRETKRLKDELQAAEKRIAELEAKLANPVVLPKTNGYWTEQEKAYEEAITLAKRQVRLAGFRCEGDE